MNYVNYVAVVVVIEEMYSSFFWCVSQILYFPDYVLYFDGIYMQG